MPIVPANTDSTPIEVIPADAVRIKAADLLSRHGFNDGDCLDGILGDAGLDPVLILGEEDGWPITLGTEVLSQIVMARFAGVLPPGAVQGRQSLAHNPVRLAPAFEGFVNEDRLAGLTAWVSPEEVVEAALQACERFSVPAATLVLR